MKKRKFKRGFKPLLATGMLIFYLSFPAMATSASSHNFPLRTTFQSAVELIEEQTGYRFFFSDELVDNNHEITLNDFSKKDIDSVVKELLNDPQLTYSIVGNNIVVKKAEKPLTTTQITQQQRLIKGVVKDDTGLELIGVSIKIKGTSQGTITNIDGTFELNVPNNATHLEISYVGYITQQVDIKNKTSIDITLKEDKQALDEVVVVGYGTQKKINLTGSVATVDGKKLDSRPLTNLGQGLEGVIPNLNVSTGSGRPGEGASFNIRGTTSINGGGPLILVDGVQMDPNQINPQDVASITVLKDAASASIYGGRAAYGVVLITTKQGELNSPTRVNYSYSYSLSRPTTLPKMVNSLTFANMYKEADNNGLVSGGKRGAADWIPTEMDIEKMKEYLANPTPENSVYIDPNTSTSTYRYVGNTDWIKEQFPGWAPLSQHNVSISGGSDKVTYIGSLGALKQKGAIKEAKQNFKRVNVSLGVTAKAFKWLDLNFKINLNQKKDDSPNVGYDNGLFMERLPTDLRPMMPIKHPDGHYSGQGQATNPFALFASGGRQKYTSEDLWVKGGFTLKPLKNVRIVGDYTWNTYHYNQKKNVKKSLEYGAPEVGSYSDGFNLTYAEVSDPAKAQFIGTHWATNLPTVSESNARDTYAALNLYAQYENTFNEDHYFKGMIGYNQEEKNNESFWVQVKNLINEDYPYLKLNNDDKPTLGSSIGDWALIGTFFRLNYIYQDKYLVEFNGRYDGSSRFAKENRWVFSPSFSLGWRISEENFFSNMKKYINDFKIRYSYGKIPNQQLSSNYPYIATMGTGYTGYIFGDEKQVYLGAPGLVSSSFTWETVKTNNIGFDFAFLDNRLKTSFDFYTRNTEGMIVAGQPLPAILGTKAPNQNAANLQTKGFEIEVNWNDYINEDLSYNISFNLADNKSKITKYNLNPTGKIGDYYVGQRLGEIWGYETEGFFTTEEEANEAMKGGSHDQSYLANIKWLPGDIKFKDLDGNSVINTGDNTISNPGDRKIIGNSTPRFRFGLMGNIEYKGWDLTAFFQGVMKRDLALGGNFFWGFSSEWAIPTTAALDYWTPENSNAYFPRVRFDSPNTQTQSKYLQNGAFIRLKQLTLGYTLPKRWTQKALLERVRMYFTGDNLWFGSSIHKSYDPEQTNRGGYPIQKMISFGIQVGF